MARLLLTLSLASCLTVAPARGAGLPPVAEITPTDADPVPGPTVDDDPSLQQIQSRHRLATSGAIITPAGAAVTVAGVAFMVGSFFVDDSERAISTGLGVGAVGVVTTVGGLGLLSIGSLRTANAIRRRDPSHGRGAGIFGVASLPTGVVTSGAGFVGAGVGGYVQHAKNAAWIHRVKIQPVLQQGAPTIRVDATF